jgi:hypothetical protein
MAEDSPESSEAQDAFELFARSFGFLGLIISWVLVYFFILAPWQAAKQHATHVAYSLTAVGITTGVCLWSLALVIGGVHGSRLIMNLAPARFGWRQGVFVLVWALATFGIYVLLQQHLRHHGYAP